MPILNTESLNFKTATLLKLDLNYSRYHLAHAEPELLVGLVWITGAVAD